MTKLLVQHGPAKGQKIETAMDNNIVNGVVFSLRDEKFDSINSFINSYEKLNKDNIFFDPQLYYSTYDKNNLKNLESTFKYPTEVSRRDMRAKTERMTNYFDDLANELKKHTNSIITPGLTIESIDWKFDYSLDIYKYFQEKQLFTNYYMTLVISSKLFHSKNDIDELLIDISEETESYNNKGIYLIINYESTNDSNYENIDAETLSNILYFVYKLKKKNFKFIIGYTFINAILFSMIDCEYVASGWFNNLRKFNSTKFENIDIFGRRKKKYLTAPLLSYISLELIKELQNVINVDILKSGSKCDAQAFDNIDYVSFVDLEHQFWETQEKIINNINEFKTIEDKLKYVKSTILNAITLTEEILKCDFEYEELKNRIKTSTSHLKEWLFAIELFIKKASIILY